MKKIILSAALLIGAATAANAQLWTSVDLGFSSNGGTYKASPTGGTSTTTDLAKSSSYSFMPTIGYNLSEHITIGAMLGYVGGSETEKDVYVPGDELKYTEGKFKVMPFVRYVGAINDNFGWYGQLDLGFASGNGKTELKTPGIATVSSEGKVGELGLNIRPGIYYQFSDHFSMNTHYGALGYNADTFIDTDGGEFITKNTSFGLDLSMSTLRFGLNYHF